MSTFGFLNPYVKSRWKERAKAFETEQRKRMKRNALAAAASGGDVKQAPGEAPQSGGDSRNAQGDAA